ncbi:MAG: hypothetical protein Q9167_000128 [Letrouitia subvulpina]
MGQQPFIYDHPSKFSFTGPSEKAWNPRAATQASWAAVTPASPKPKREGPLIDAREFNRHPDSYITSPYGNLNWKPMSPRTKTKVKYLRFIQLFFRVCEFLGALGLLFCVICIKGTSGSTGWITRVPAAVAILHTVYAIYHLGRSAQARTPASSASYMIFAAILDVGLVSFLVFTAILSQAQYLKPVHSAGRWTSLFIFDDTTTKIIHSTLLISIVNGATHTCSFLISTYLAFLFRKISKLPPDMNPLEDNLTSRHKRNKSSISNDEYRHNQTSNTTDSKSKRSSQAEVPLISPVRAVPFMYTRNESSSHVGKISRTDKPGSLYDQRPNPESSWHTNSRLDYLDSQVPSRCGSRTEMNVHMPTTSTFGAAETDVGRKANVSRSPTKSSSVYSEFSRPPSTRPTSTIPAFSRPQSTTPSLPDTNWITYPSPSTSPPLEFRHLRINNNNNNQYQPLPQMLPDDDMENFVPRPLKMNPPTPVNMGRRTTDQRVLVSGTGNTNGFASANPSDINVLTGRGGGYGDLGGYGSGNGKARGGDGYQREVGGRVVSRSGAEVGGQIEGIGRGIRARDISGKMLEEREGVGIERLWQAAR